MAVTERQVADLADTLLRHQVLVQRLSAGERTKFLPFLQKLDKKLRAELVGRDELTSYRRDRLERLLKAVDVMIDEILSGFQRQLLVDIDDIAVNESQFSARALSTMIDIDAVTPGVTLVRAAVLNNPLSIRHAPLLKAFIKDWTAAERKAVSGAIRQGVFRGETNAQIVRAIRGTQAARYADGLLAVTKRHADTLVHTAIQHASSQARQATFDENADIVEGVQWISTLDSKTCPVCRSLDKSVFARDKGPRSPIHPSCLPGDALVSTGHRITGATKRPFNGDLIIISTASGKKLASTPNHPVLTRRGWVSARDVRVGDDVVRDLRYRGPGRRMNHKDVPARIEDIAETFLGSSEVTSVPVPTAAEHFHGDGVDGEVAIVGTDRLLRNWQEPQASELIGKLKFVGRNVARTALSGYRASTQFIEGALSAAHCVMCGSSQLFPLVVSGSTHAGLLLGGPVAPFDIASLYGGNYRSSPDAKLLGDTRRAYSRLVHPEDLVLWESGLDRMEAMSRLDAGSRESSVDRFSRDAKLARDIIDGAFGSIEFDRVIDTDYQPFSGHVFNLETESGFYSANGIVTHNCRCTMVPWFGQKFAFLMRGATRASAGAGGGKQVDGNLDYYEWLKTQPPAFIEVALGRKRARLFLSGGLTPERFSTLQLDRNFKPITLAEMKAIEPIAFARAGL